ncbi:uncharacterized protein Bfra_001610 [Botrytis fragariae]|uniref:Uncharacterized protein n=1 Tax=Botrytis fragariae TaxID=1964551 RepID=A0A8H6EM65_9HELO|nr:uncharacterized protein Bfra_001610 [Botrytis fragariae]KAF5877244.1 hypothetical protein Bfra_001610 [Botrytis fragariae]
MSTLTPPEDQPTRARSNSITLNQHRTATHLLGGTCDSTLQVSSRPKSKSMLDITTLKSETMAENNNINSHSLLFLRLKNKHGDKDRSMDSQESLNKPGGIILRDFGSQESLDDLRIATNRITKRKVYTSQQKQISDTMGTEIPKNPSKSLPITTSEWDDDIDKIKVTNDPKIWEEMSHLAWPTNSLIPMLLEASKFREEEKIEEAREIVRRIKHTQMIRKIEEEEELHSKGDGNAEEGEWMVVDAMAVMDEMRKMDRNLKEDGYTKRHKAEKGLGKCNMSWAIDDFDFPTPSNKTPQDYPQISSKMGCGPSKPPVPPNEKHQRRSTRGAYAPRKSDKSSPHASRPVEVSSSHRAVSTRVMNEYASYLQAQRNVHNTMNEVSTEQNPQKEQDRVKESRLSWAIPERRSSLGVITLGAQTNGGNTIDARKLGAGTLEASKVGVHTGGCRIIQSISNPGLSAVSPPTPRQDEDDFGSRPVSPVSSVGTTKWDRPGNVLKG